MTNGDALDTKDEAEAARLAMSQLPAEQQEVLRLAIDQGLTHSEIAERLDMPLGTVKTRIRRGLATVREKMLAMHAGVATEVTS